MRIEPGLVVEGRYRLGEPLGAGGMATVWAAVDLRLGAPVAIKVLTSPSASLQERMGREGKVQARLRHPNVVAVTDRVEVGGCPALVMERVFGVPLDALGETLRLTSEEAEQIFRGILAGVGAAHDLGLVHRDLKPGNVLVTLVDGAPLPKVADFGLVKLTDDGSARNATRTGAAMGTPSYMAPEQTRDAAHVDARADVWALGAILFELLAGRPAFEGRDLLDLLQRKAAGQRATLPEGVEPRLARVIDACLEVEPDRRPRSCAEVEEMLGPPPPRRPARADLVDALRPPPSEPERAASAPASGATWGATPEPDFEPPRSPTLDGAPPSRPAPARLRRGAWGVILLAAALAVALAVPLGRGSPEQFGEREVPSISDPVLESAVRSAWGDLLAGRARDARLTMEAALASEPEDARVWLLASTTALAFGRSAAWRHEIRRAAELAADQPGDDHELARELGRRQAAEPDLAWWDSVLGAWCAERPDHLLGWVTWMVRPATDPAARLESALAATQRRPGVVLVWHVAAELALRLDRERARETIDRGLAMHPSAAVLWATRARVDLDAERYAEAEDHARRARELDPSLEVAWRAGFGAVIPLGDPERYQAWLDAVGSGAVPPEVEASARSGARTALARAGRFREAREMLAGAVRASTRAGPGTWRPVQPAIRAVREATDPMLADAEALESQVALLRAVLANADVDANDRAAGDAVLRDAAAILEARADLSAPAAARIRAYARRTDVGELEALPVEECHDALARAWSLAAFGRAPDPAPACFTVAARHAVRARNRAALGRAEEAQSALDAFLQAWPDADPSLPARRVLAREVDLRALPPAAWSDWMDGRAEPVFLGIAPVAGPDAEPWTKRLLELVGAPPRTRVVALGAGDEAEILRQARDARVDQVLFAETHRIADERSFGVRAVDARTGDLLGTARATRPEAEILDHLPSLVLLTLTDEPAFDRRSALIRAMPHARTAACVARSTAARPGEIALTWRVLPSGRAADVAVLRDDVSEPALAACLVRAIEDAAFPAGEPVSLTWPFQIGPGGP